MQSTHAVHALTAPQLACLVQVRAAALKCGRVQRQDGPAGVAAPRPAGLQGKGGGSLGMGSTVEGGSRRAQQACLRHAVPCLTFCQLSAHLAAAALAALFHCGSAARSRNGSQPTLDWVSMAATRAGSGAGEPSSAAPAAVPAPPCGSRVATSTRWPLPSVAASRVAASGREGCEGRAQHGS